MSEIEEKVDVVESPTSFAIESIDQMYSLFHQWHAEKCGVLNHMLNIPEGTVIEDSAGIKHELSNEYLAGFKSGVEVALIELTEMPFTITPSVEPT
jgi:hypothetical protein